jgi:putative tryptophan/tyrosine transport system substrate-binding protein
MIRRRAFISLLGGAATWPLTSARAQQSAVGLVGLLSGGQLDDRLIEAVRQGLKDGGYVEARNIAIKYRSADGHFDRLPTLAAELAADPVAVIVALFSPTPAVAAKSVTSTIPIVFAIGADPIDLGLVSSLNRPGGNVTGVTFFINTLGAKRLELMQELVPSGTIIGFLVNPRNPTTESQSRDVQTAARRLGVDIVILNASSESDIDDAFTAVTQRHFNAVMIGADAFFTGRRDQLVALARRYAIPAMYYLREFVTTGGLISYGASITDAYRLAGRYASRILKGKKPADLPVQQSTKFEMMINLNTARALGLTVPDKLLALADEVIE